MKPLQCLLVLRMVALMLCASFSGDDSSIAEFNTWKQHNHFIQGKYLPHTDMRIHEHRAIIFLSVLNNHGI